MVCRPETLCAIIFAAVLVARDGARSEDPMGPGTGGGGTSAWAGPARMGVTAVPSPSSSS
eukprot:2158517-Alexandrium_andersonii.AAC.1